jgi:hypothetical protein
VRDGFAIAPDFKVGDVAGQTGTFAGFYGGWMIDNTVLFGGGGYWLTNGNNGTSMGYGGFVVQWLARSDRRIGFGAHALIGGGTGTVVEDRAFQVPSFGRNPRDPRPIGGQTGVFRVQLRDDFFIAEPQADLHVNFSPRLRLVFGAGYRLVGAGHSLDDQLRGVSGSVSLQVGGSRVSR